MRQKFFKFLFGGSGDLTTIPDPVQGSGDVSFAQGYGPNFTRDLATDPLALPIDRAKMNYLYNTITAQLQQYQQYGAPEWITSADNGGTPFAYDYGAKVRYSATNAPPFLTYFSVVPGVGTNTSTPGADANWRLLGVNGFEFFNATYAAAIGGYPINCVLQKANFTGFWINQSAGNSNNPDTGGAGWTTFICSSPQSWSAAQSGVIVPINPVAAAGTLTLPFAQGNNFVVGKNVNGSSNVTNAINANFILGTPSGITPGITQSGQIEFAQDATGGRVISSFSTTWESTSGARPNLVAGANGRDIMYYSVGYDGKVYYSMMANPS